MNAKTTKFLTVLAVLVMAFAAVAVFAPAENDAAETKSVWTMNPGAGVASYITLGTDVIKPTDGQKLANAKAYYVDTDMTLEIPAEANVASGGILIFLKAGVELMTVVPEEHENTIAFAVIGVKESTKDGNTILTLHANYNGTAIANWDDGTASHNIKYPQVWSDVKGNQMIGLSKTQGGGHFGFYEGASIQDSSKNLTYISYIDKDLAAYGNAAIWGEFQYVYEHENVNSVFSFVNATGKIAGYGEENAVQLNGFTGTFAIGADKSVTVTKYVSGDLTVTKGTISSDVAIPKGNFVKFNEGTIVTAQKIFKNVDEYGDTHSFYSTVDLTVGLGGLILYSGQNMIDVSGTISLTASAELKFNGNARISGTIYSGVYQVTINAADVNNRSDVKIASLQTTGSGYLTLSTNVLVEAGKSLYSAGMIELVDGFVLKVAEGAVVKAGASGGVDSGIKVSGTSQIWNAGRVIADKYWSAANTPEKAGALYSVYMNNVDGAGVFYKGSDVYHGGSNLTPITDAFGAYLNMTGKSTIDLTSNITVKNVLYKYSTMILATYDTTIALTVYFDNQYSASVTLDGKASSVPETTAKSATFRNVVWNSPSNAIISVTAPEEYTVQLIKTHTTNADVITPTSWWDSTGIVVKDPTGRALPISVNDGVATVKLVFGVEYTVTGLVATSNYNFDDLRGVLNDLTKDSQTQGSFTMIRNVGENANDTKTFVYLEITEGKKDTITVTLKDDDGKIAVGDVIFYYTTDGGKTVKALMKPTSGAITFDIFNNDTVFIKYPAIEYYKIESAAASTGANLTISSVSAADKMTGWAQKLIPSNDTVTTGAMVVTCSLNEVEQSFELINDKAVGKTSVITVEFSKYYEGSAVHGAKKVLVWDTNNKTTLKMFVGEVYTLTWTDVEDVWEKMTYKPTGDATAEAKDYTEGTSVTVDATKRTYTLTLDNIEYAAVKNSTDKDFTVSDGYFYNEVKKTETVTKAVEAKEDYPTGEKLTTVSLLLEGQTVVAWTYTITPATPATGQDAPIPGAPVEVVGPTAAIELKKDDLITVTKLTAIYNPYIVKIQPVEHMKIGDYSRVGYINDRMFIYASADDMYKVTGVKVYYEDPAHEGFPGEFYTDALFSTDLGYWYYIMPASNVVLVPQIESDFGTITFENYDGSVLEIKRVQKGDMPIYSGETPVKPSTATESYKFVGWEPELHAVDGDETYVAQFEVVGPTSTDVTIFLEKIDGGVKVTLLANDGRDLQAGTIEFTYYYAYMLNNVWATGFKTCTAEADADGTLYQFNVDLSEQERFSETMWIQGTYTSDDGEVESISELIVYQ